ncbi:hypothetical protein [Caldicoprobacter algeriensis]|uniref:hypothetical protein n=1 Tax=Caldicoprobacter algeriensis TaxID=699281 RepID=UPI00207A70BB|nr:hypothetical protein [Caldicoprobacter algeriensis]
MGQKVLQNIKIFCSTPKVYVEGCRYIWVKTKIKALSFAAAGQRMGFKQKTAEKDFGGNKKFREE